MYRQTDDNEIVIELNEVVDNSTNTVPALYLTIGRLYYEMQVNC